MSRNQFLQALAITIKNVDRIIYLITFVHYFILYLENSCNFLIFEGDSWQIHPLKGASNNLS
jgi:hypothetical protein